jgi:hypothetical protein
VAEAEDSLERAKAQVQSALKNIASLLRQPALRSLLEEGKAEQFIADVLAASSDEKLGDILAECVPVNPDNAKLLPKYLKKIIVKVVHLNEFHPSKTKVEKSDIETVVGEFRKFLEAALDGEGTKQTTILEVR